MPSRVKKPRSEQRRSSGVGTSPASAKMTKTTVSVPIPATSPILPTPTAQPCSVPEIQIPPSIPAPVPVPVTVLKSTPVKLNNSSIVTVRQEIRYCNLLVFIVFCFFFYNDFLFPQQTNNNASGSCFTFLFDTDHHHSGNCYRDYSKYWGWPGHHPNVPNYNFDWNTNYTGGSACKFAYSAFGQNSTDFCPAARGSSRTESYRHSHPCQRKLNYQTGTEKVNFFKKA